MQVAIDARELAGDRTGTGRYLDRLLVHWARLNRTDGHEFTLYAHQPITVPALSHARVRILPGAGGTRWEQLTLASVLRRDRPQVLFAPAYTSPLLTTIPTVLTVHDVSFAAHPEWFRPREGWRRRVLTRAAARRARVVLTVSQFSKGEIERHFGVPAERICVIPHGIGGLEAAAVPRPERSARQIQPRVPVVLFVGSILNRRHVPDLISAIGLVGLELPDVRLVIAGDNRTWPYEDPAAIAGELGISDRVDVKSFVTDEELQRLYTSAAVFAFVSEYEDFALTPLEALAAGVPPLLLDTPVSREIYGQAARYVPRPEPALIASHLLALLRDDAARGELLSHAPSILARYEWTRAAAQTLDAIEQAADR